MLAHYRATLATRETELACIESELAPWARQEPLAASRHRLLIARGGHREPTMPGSGMRRSRCGLVTSRHWVRLARQPGRPGHIRGHC
jgi:hypothetical protein